MVMGEKMESRWSGMKKVEVLSQGWWQRKWQAWVGGSRMNDARVDRTGFVEC